MNLIQPYQPVVSNVMRDYITSQLFGGMFNKSSKYHLDRTLGREAEFALMRLEPLGLPGSNIPLIEFFKGNDRYLELTMTSENGDKIVRGYYDTQTEFSFITEAGKPTIEILFPVFTNLITMYEALCNFMIEFIPIVLQTEQVLIGVGIQPAADPSTLYDLWFPGMRYHLLRDLFLEKYCSHKFSKKFSSFSQDFHDLSEQGVNIVTITSSDQPHVELHSPEEMVLAYNVKQVLTPIYMAIFRNSPIYGINTENPQQIHYKKRAYASRELLWRVVNSQQSGFSGFYQDPEEIVGDFAFKQCYFQSNNGNYTCFDRPFFELPDNDINKETWAFLCGTDYSVARRTDHGTFEIRSICQQSPFKGGTIEEQFLPLMVPIALNLGVMLSLKELWAEIQKRYITMDDVSSWYLKVQKFDLGDLCRDRIFVELLYLTISKAWNALVKRGLGEEHFIIGLKSGCDSKTLHRVCLLGKHSHISEYGEGKNLGFHRFLQSVAFGDTLSLF